MFDLKQLLRPHIKTLIPYASARDDYKEKEGVFLDANENPLGSITAEPWNRYPDPYQRALKRKIGEIKKIRPGNIFLGNGSDEPIDLLFRAFGEPGIDNVIINPPTYGMYKVSADINNVLVKEVLLDREFDLNVTGILEAIDARTKLIFICSPNNPTGNSLSEERIEKITRNFDGIVVVDEAYIDFTDRTGLIEQLYSYPNLVVLQTFSKAWGLAGLRLGMAFASRDILAILNKIKAPYNLSSLTQQTVLEALDDDEKKCQMVDKIIENRKQLKIDLDRLSLVKKIYPSDANFLLVEVSNAKQIYDQLIDRKVIVRDRSRVVLCENGLRITVGTKFENEQLITTLKELNL